MVLRALAAIIYLLQVSSTNLPRVKEYKYIHLLNTKHVNSLASLGTLRLPSTLPSDPEHNEQPSTTLSQQHHPSTLPHTDTSHAAILTL